MKMKLIPLILSVMLLANRANAQQEMNFSDMAAAKVSAETVPDSYVFSWKYTMEMKSDKGKAMNAEYLLEPKANYFGMSMTTQDNTMLMIMDAKNKISVTAFGQAGQKMAMASKLPDYGAMAEKQAGNKSFTYKALPEKTILGYKCKGVEATNSEYTMIFYFTNEAPVNFANLFKSPQGQKMADPFKDYFKPGDKPLMMSVDITDKAKGTKTSMLCVALEKQAFTFKKADYTFM